MRTPDGYALELDGYRCYAALLDGADPKYRFNRRFCRRKTSIGGRRGRWVLLETPGFYEVCDKPYGWTQRRKRYFVYDGAELYRIPDGLVSFLPEAVEGPGVGEPGEWFSNTCACGQPVAFFDSKGFPQCGEHREEADAVPANA